MITVSLALLFRSTVAIASRAIFLFLIAWLCLKVPAVIAAPQIEGVWIGFGEIGMLLAGGWVLFATLSEWDTHTFFRHMTGQRGVRMAQILFGLAVIPVGLGHIFYVQITTSLVPSWMPFRMGLAYLTGVGQIACGLAIAFLSSARRCPPRNCDVGAIRVFVWGPDTWFTATPKMAGTPPGFIFVSF